MRRIYEAPLLRKGAVFIQQAAVPIHDWLYNEIETNGYNLFKEKYSSQFELMPNIEVIQPVNEKQIL